MPVRDADLQRLKGFPAGIDNVADEADLPRSEAGLPLALREAVNVDLGTGGKPRRRRGYALAKAMTRPHSGFGGWPDALLCVADGALTALDVGLTATAIRAGIGDAGVSYAPVGQDCYWTNGAQLRKVTPDLEDRHAAVTCPTQPTVTPYATGGLAEGTYQVAATCLDDDGMESGSTLATLVDVPAGGGVLVEGLTGGPEAATFRVYLSGADGEKLYAARDVPVGTTSCILGRVPQGKLLATQWLAPLRPGRILRTHAARLFSADRECLRWSEAMRYGLAHADNYFRFRGVAMVEPVGQAASSGLFVANDKRTLWLPGPDPKQWQQIIARPHGAVFGTGCQVEASWFGTDLGTGKVAFWLGTDGVFCLGLATGQVIPLTEGRLALPEFTQGAVLMQQQGGIRQIIAALIGGGTNAFAASDSAVATIRRHGDAADL